MSKRTSQRKVDSQIGGLTVVNNPKQAKPGKQLMKTNEAIRKSKSKTEEAPRKIPRKSVPQYARTPLEKIILTDTELRQAGDTATYYWRPLFVQALQDKAVAMAKRSLEWNEEREFDMAKYARYQSQSQKNEADVETEDFDEDDALDAPGLGMRASACMRLHSACDKHAFIDKLLPAIEAQFAGVVSGAEDVPQPWRQRTLKGIVEGRAIDIKKYDDETSSESEELASQDQKKRKRRKKLDDDGSGSDDANYARESTQKLKRMREKGNSKDEEKGKSGARKEKNKNDEEGKKSKKRDKAEKKSKVKRSDEKKKHKKKRKVDNR